MNPSDSQESLNSSSSVDSSGSGDFGESPESPELIKKGVLPRQDASDSPMPFTRTLSADSFFAPKKESESGEKKSFDEKLLMLRDKTSVARDLFSKIQFVNSDEYNVLLGEKYIKKDADSEVFLEKIAQIKNKLSQKKLTQEDCFAAVLLDAKVRGDAEQRDEFLLYFSDRSEEKEYPRSIRFDVEKDREMLNKIFFSKEEMEKMAKIEKPEWPVMQNSFYCITGDKEEYCEKFAMIFDLFQNYEQSHEILKDIKENKHFNPKSLDLKSFSIGEFEMFRKDFEDELVDASPSPKPQLVHKTVLLPSGKLETAI